MFLLSERAKLKRSDYPLVLRVLQGPCEQVSRIFLMEQDLGEEVTYDVRLLMYNCPIIPGLHTTV